MKKLILIIFLFSVGLYSQAFREIYTTKIILNPSEDDNSNLFIVQVPTLTQSVTFTIPVGQGTSGDVLTTNGINSTTWTGLDGGSVGGSGDGLVQFQNNGFGASNSFIWDNTNGFLGVGLTSPSFTLHTSGTISIGSVANPAVLAIGSANASGKYLYIKTSASSNSSVNFILPVDNGVANQGLLSNSSGSLSWGGEIRQGPVSNNTPDDNQINSNSDNAYIGGGDDNSINSSSQNSTIFGGEDNQINSNSQSTMLVGGDGNSSNSNSDYSVITGGTGNQLNSNSNASGIGGGDGNQLNSSSAYSFIGSGKSNSSNSNSNSNIIFSGESNAFNSSTEYSLIGAGESNSLQGNYSANFAGYQNTGTNSNGRSVIFGGQSNNNKNTDSFIGNGNGNSTNQTHSVILNGYDNDLTSTTDHSAILWGRGAGMSGTSQYSYIGGRDASVSNDSDDGIMFGRKPQCSNRTGCFLFGDSNDATLSASASNQFRARFSGGYRLWSNAAMNVGVGMDAGDNAWTSVSDRNMKTAISSLNPLTFLNKIKKLDIFSWSYIGSEDEGIRNYGPMAQDFFSLFGKDELGTFGNDKSIKELDAAAIFILGVQGSKIEVDSQSNDLKNAIFNSDNIDAKLRELENKLNSLEKEIK